MLNDFWLKSCFFGFISYLVFLFVCFLDTSTVHCFCLHLLINKNDRVSSGVIFNLVILQCQVVSCQVLGTYSRNKLLLVSSNFNMYIENLFELGLRPLVILPTKVNIGNIITRFSIIDHIWVSDELRGDQTLVIPISMTDHFPVVSVISAGFQFVSGVSSRRRLVGRGREAFRIFLSNIHVNMSRK